MRRPETICLNGKEYPVICNLNVLEVLQSKFGSVNQFEFKLLGLVIQRDDKHNILYQKNGDPVMLSTEPSIEAVKIALVEMVREGERVNAYLNEEQAHFTDPEDLLNDCDIPFGKLAHILHDVYKRCFVSKKQ